MNDNNTPIGIKEKDECPNVEFKARPRDTSSRIIAAVSVFVLVFTVILAIAITLINAEWGDSSDTPETTPGQSVMTPPDEIQSNIENNRDKPSLPSHANAKEDASAYRPKDSANAKAIEGASSASALLVDLSSGTVVAGQ